MQCHMKKLMSNIHHNSDLSKTDLVTTFSVVVVIKIQFSSLSYQFQVFMIFKVWKKYEKEVENCEYIYNVYIYILWEYLLQNKI